MRTISALNRHTDLFDCSPKFQRKRCSVDSGVALFLRDAGLRVGLETHRRHFCLTLLVLAHAGDGIASFFRPFGLT